tara:strand:- start:387 stop:656 length:270 start_codon:yes stop_codon:yes gene_type:complete
MVKRKEAKKEKPKDIDINIKVNNLDKAVRAGIRHHKKNKWKCNGSGFWVFGSALSMILSYSQNSSILWAILHGIISWFYVIYRIILLYV